MSRRPVRSLRAPGVTLVPLIDGKPITAQEFMSMPESRRKVIEDTRTALLKRVEEVTDKVRAIARETRNKLEELDRWIRARLSEVAPKSRLVVTSHPFLEPFIQEYGLRGVGSLVQGGADLDQLSAGQLARLTDRLRQAGVRVMFTDSAVPAPAVRQLARALGARVVQLHSDSLGPAGSGAATYLEYMRTNVSRVVEALGRGR